MEAEWKALLVDMGFTPELAEKALRATNASGVEAAIEYIQKLQDQNEEEGTNDSVDKMDVGDNANASATATSAPVILTEEERIARDEKVKQLRLKVTAERAEKERVETIDREKQRRGKGIELSEIREKYELEETKRMIAERRRDKDVELKERDRLRALIEQDKLNRKKFQADEVKSSTTDSLNNSGAPVTAPTTSAGGDTSIRKPSTDHKETRIQIRQLNGERLAQTFQAAEPLSAVRLYCELNRTDKSTAPFVFIQLHPRREFSNDDYLAPLKYLDLVPSGTLHMTKPPFGSLHNE